MSAQANFFDEKGAKKTIDLPADVFSAPVNMPALHEAVRSRLAAVRAGTSSTKTRAEVRGGGVKPWRQKGTGRARHGSTREPQWVGGGVAHGPRPGRRKLRVNKKARALALRSALTDRAGQGQIVVVDMPAFDTPKTKRAAELLTNWGAEGKSLIVFSPDEMQAHLNAWRSFRNLPLALPVVAPATYTVLEAETVIFTKKALDALSKAPA
ncbi:MAG: 50S ribosomal protein L4 [Actinomycetota bacterium]